MASEASNASETSNAVERARDIVRREVDNLDHLGDIHFRLTVELDRRDISLADVRHLRPGDVVELDKLIGEASVVRVNDHPFAEGEIIALEDVVCCRLSRFFPPADASSGRQTPEQALPPEAMRQASQFTSPVDEREMAYIPTGPFTMGGSSEDSPTNERPAHAVYLSDYFIDLFPVTNQDYRDFVHATGYKTTPHHWSQGIYPTGTARHPVTNVSWRDARAYAEWAGKRLPTEAEWEKAARGGDERPYPWGGRFVVRERCNSTNYYGTTTPVDEFPDGRSPYGIWDMAGNVYEWCSDCYDEEYYKSSPATNPQGPEGGQERSIRGGDYQETRAGVRTTHRTGQAETYNRDNIGFRCVLDTPRD